MVVRRPRNYTKDMPKFTPDILTAAIEGFEAQKRQIDAQIAALKQMLNPGAAAEPAPAPPKRKRRLSAAGRKAIGDAARKRWAAVKAAKAQAAPAVGPKRAGRKRRRAKA